MDTFKKLLTFISFLLFQQFVFAQLPQIAVVHANGTTVIYTSSDTAYALAVNDDYIYLPSGNFTFPPISKRIHIFGTGHNPDSTIATGRTIINGLQLNTGADNGSVTGIYLSGNINFSTIVAGYSISRCNISGAIFGLAQNVIISENIIGSYSACYGCDGLSINISSPNVSLNNNILQSRVSLTSAVIRNNILLFAYTFSNGGSVSNSLIENNIFNQSFAGSGNTYNNNLNGGPNGIDNNGNQGSGNVYTSQPLDSIFVNYHSGWNYASNFHLRPGSPYHNIGTDGTDLGIYGGLFSWNEGSVPSNPHIYFKQIAPQTGSNGTLNVQIKVRTNN